MAEIVKFMSENGSSDYAFLLFVFLIVGWAIKKLISSPKEIAEFFDYMGHRRIESLSKLLTYPALTFKQRNAVEKEQQIVVLRKLTRITNRHVIFPLWEILYAERNTLPMTYFKSVSAYIERDKLGNLTLELPAEFWVLEWGLTRLMALMIFLTSIVSVIGIINFHHLVTLREILMMTVYFYVSFFMSFYLWASSLRRKKINAIRALLLKYSTCR